MYSIKANGIVVHSGDYEGFHKAFRNIFLARHQECLETEGSSLMVYSRPIPAEETVKVVAKWFADGSYFTTNRTTTYDKAICLVKQMLAEDNICSYAYITCERTNKDVFSYEYDI